MGIWMEPTDPGDLHQPVRAQFVRSTEIWVCLDVYAGYRGLGGPSLCRIRVNPVYAGYRGLGK